MSLRKGQRVKIVIQGERHEAEYLGRGRFAKAYRMGQDVVLYVSQRDAAKEILVMCPEGPHIPTIRKVETIWRNDADRVGAGVFIMPYYPIPTARDKEVWATLKHLNEVRNQVYGKVIGCDARSITYAGVDISWGVCQAADVSDSEREALLGLQYTASNFGAGYTFDGFAPRNIGIGPDGQIIFRDVVYNAADGWCEHCQKMRCFHRLM